MVDPIPPPVRRRATAALGRAYEALEQATARFRHLPSPILERALASGELPQAVAAAIDRSDLLRAVETAADDLATAPIDLHAVGRRADDGVPLGSTIDSTVVAVALARRVGWAGDRMRYLAGGALLRDVGMLLVPPDLVGAPRRLTESGRARVRLHPRLGYALLRQLRPGDLLTPHVAYQHHERQDGRGYPRGLAGTNRVGRTLFDPPRGPNGRILLEAEIVAVADVFTALTGECPQRPPYSLELVAGTLRRLAGSQLNRELVATLLSALPVFPLGATVVVESGELARYRGLVTRVHPEMPERPTIRLLRDPDGRPTSPTVIDLRRLDLTIAVRPFEPLGVPSLGHRRERLLRLRRVA